MLDMHTKVMVWVWLRLNAIWVKKKLSRAGGAAAYPVGAAAYTAGAAAYTVGAAAYTAGAAAYTAGAAAYIRSMRIKLTQFSWAEAEPELGKNKAMTFGNYISWQPV